jgi:CO/xanthine dehydrogenase FAD-binding subunit
MRAEEAVVREAVRTQLTDIEPSDLHASADYRRPAAACLTVRAIWTPTAMQ